MDYRYNFQDDKKVDIKKILFIVFMIVIAVMVTAFFFRNSNNKILAKVSNIVSKPISVTINISSKIGTSVKNIFVSKDEIIAQNDTLKEENENLKYQLLELKKIEDENVSLKEMLEIKKTYQHFKILTAKISYREHDNWSQTFKINVGQNDGVKKGQAVVCKNGLVGYISNVEENESLVTTLLDPSSSVSVTTSALNEPAILKGDLELKAQNKLKLEFIQLDAQVSISDVVYTSGIGSLYPQSIPVGTVTEIVNGKNDINRHAIVELNTNIYTLKEVGVIIE